MNDQQTREHHVPEKSGNIDNRRRRADTGTNENLTFNQSTTPIWAVENEVYGLW